MKDWIKDEREEAAASDEVTILKATIMLPDDTDTIVMLPGGTPNSEAIKSIKACEKSRAFAPLLEYQV